MVISLVAFMAVFTVVVLIHETGHFIAAKAAGVKVYEFSIGFPFSPKVLTLFRHKETDFTLRLLPLGGFVSFLKDGDEVVELFRVSSLRRAAIVSAGSLCNAAFAFLIFVTVFAAGKHLSLLDAMVASAKLLWEILGGTVAFIVNLICGRGTMEGLAGPVGIASMAGQAASKGLISLLYFTGILSMSLGIINLLPLPALDGGQLAMLAAEAVRRKPLPLRTYRIATVLGLSLFLVLTLLVTCRDIVRLLA